MIRQSAYPLFYSHLDLAHQYWERVVQTGDKVIDATSGNGYDTLKLAQLALNEQEGTVYAMDIQPIAIERTKEYLSSSLTSQQYTRVCFLVRCHSQFPKEIEPHTIRLIVYNLGYLPGGNKELTTSNSTTLKSLQEAQHLIMPGGVISLTCYSGHSEGSFEKEALLDYVSILPKTEWSCCHHEWMNRRQAPSLLILQKVYVPDSF
jgi:hypothetical protein